MLIVRLIENIKRVLYNPTVLLLLIATFQYFEIAQWPPACVANNFNDRQITTVIKAT